jgi:hypothetical protein
MSVVEFETMKIRQQEIEVRALVALLNTETLTIKRKCEAKLYGIAFPESLVEKINQETLGVE